MPAPRRTVGTLEGSVAGAGGSITAGLGALGTGTGAAAGSVGASGPGLTPAAGASADFVMIRSCAFTATTKPATARAHKPQIATSLRRRAAPQRSSVVMPNGRYRGVPIPIVFPTDVRRTVYINRPRTTGPVAGSPDVRLF
jgi:hypothetical protein